MTRKPRQPRNTFSHKYTSGLEARPQRLPPGVKLSQSTKNAMAIQRAWRARKAGQAQQKAVREVKSQTMTTQTYTVAHSAKTDTQMANGQIILPGPFNTHGPKLVQGTGENDLIGVWAMPRYLIQRFIVNWASLTGHGDLAKGPELRVRMGFIKNTGWKHGARTDSYAHWCDDINKLVHHEIQKSGMDDNFLTYSKRNRTVVILKDYMVRPNLNQRVADTDSQNHDFAPPKNIEVKWDRMALFPRNKQRMTHVADAYVMNNTFIPFVYFSSNNITVHMGALDIHTSSKFYFSDP